MILYPRLPFVKAAEAARLAEARGAAQDRSRRTCAIARSSCSCAAASRSRRRCRRSWPSSPIARGGRRRWSGRRIRRTTSRSRAATRREKIINDATQGTRAAVGSAAPRRRRPTTATRTAASRADPNALALPTAPQATIARNEPSRNPTLGGPAPGVLSDAIRNVQKYSQGESLQNVQGSGDFGPSIQFDTKGVEFGPWLRRFVAQIRRNWFVPYAAMSLRGHVVLSFKVHRDGSITDLQIMKPSAIDAFTKSAFNAIKLVEPDRAAAARVPGRERAVHRHVLFQRNAAGRRLVRRNADRRAAALCRPARSRVGLFLVADGARDLRRSRAPGRGEAAARRDRRSHGDREERARHRAREAVRRRDRQLRLDGGLSRLRHRHRQGAARPSSSGIPHHMVDVVDPTEEYSAARYAREAAAVIRDITARGRLPILVGGTGFYYRALTRGLFEGPGRDEPLRRRLERVAERRGPARAASLAGEGRSAVGRADPDQRTSSASSARSRCGS